MRHVLLGGHRNFANVMKPCKFRMAKFGQTVDGFSSQLRWGVENANNILSEQSLFELLKLRCFITGFDVGGFYQMILTNDEYESRNTALSRMVIFHFCDRYV